MMPRHVAPWFEKACRIHASMKLPRIEAKASEPVNVYVYDAIGFDPWSGEGLGAKQIAERVKGYLVTRGPAGGVMNL